MSSELEQFYEVCISRTTYVFD